MDKKVVESYRMTRRVRLTGNLIVSDIRNFAFGLAKAFVYGLGKNRKQKFVMLFTIDHSDARRSVLRGKAANIVFCDVSAPWSGVLFY